MKTPRSSCTRTLRTAAMFGLDLTAPRSLHRARVANLAAVADQAARAISSGGVLLITGPSGAGKSTLMALLRARLGHTREVNPEKQLAHLRACVCTLSAQPLDDWLAHLARFGLGEAMLWLQRPRELSTGQRWRLAFALRFTGPRPVLACDEFAAQLDRPTAVALAMTLRREHGRTPHARLILATSHDDLTCALRPHVHVDLDLHAHARVTRHQPLTPVITTPKAA